MEKEKKMVGRVEIGELPICEMLPFSRAFTERFPSQLTVVTCTPEGTPKGFVCVQITTRKKGLRYKSRWVLNAMYFCDGWKARIAE